MNYTSKEIREAEGLLTYQATHAGDAEKRARARITLALIQLLDLEKVNWREDLAQEIQTKVEAGLLPNFNPDRPFTLDFASIDDMLSKLTVGAADGVRIKEDFGIRF